jgi:hypothetical protein
MRTSTPNFVVIALVACCGLLCQGTLLAQSNLVVNGGFETGDFTGWTTASGCSAIVASYGEPLSCFGGFINQVPAHSGTWATIFPQTAPGTISQTIATSPVATYELSFWLIAVDNGTGSSPNAFSVSWGGAILFSATNIATAGYTKLTFAGLTPTGQHTVLSFTGSDTPAALGLDDVSVKRNQGISNEKSGNE